MSVLDRNAIAERYRRVRAQTEALASPLSSEDMIVQSMPDASPAKWHLAHTTWFFQEFVLWPFAADRTWPDDRWRVLFNSYYESVGPSHFRAARGLLSRPSLEDVRAWRARVDEQMHEFLRRAEPPALAVALLGTHHEQQHQELLLTDIKHAFFANPMKPPYQPRTDRSGAAPSRALGEEGSTTPSRESPAQWLPYDERLAVVGHEGDGFSFDNERPGHRSWVGSFSLASRLVSNAEYARFIEDDGYERPELWLSAGFAERKAHGWVSPLYWERTEAGWRSFTLHGVQPLEPQAPAVHVSFYEADAYARWAGARLPTEEEWEVAATALPLAGSFVESRLLAPAPADAHARGPSQIFGDAWEWTASAYLPYPRFAPLQGALGEYNGKFMSGQMTLRGGSCLSPQSHLRLTYRNYFPPHTRWQMTGVRLAKDS